MKYLQIKTKHILGYKTRASFNASQNKKNREIVTGAHQVELGLDGLDKCTFSAAQAAFTEPSDADGPRLISLCAFRCIVTVNPRNSRTFLKLKNDYSNLTGQA